MVQVTGLQGRRLAHAAYTLQKPDTQWRFQLTLPPCRHSHLHCPVSIAHRPSCRPESQRGCQMPSAVHTPWRRCWWSQVPRSNGCRRGRYAAGPPPPAGTTRETAQHSPRPAYIGDSYRLPGVSNIVGYAGRHQTKSNDVLAGCVEYRQRWSWQDPYLSQTAGNRQSPAHSIRPKHRGEAADI